MFLTIQRLNVQRFNVAKIAQVLFIGSEEMFTCLNRRTHTRVAKARLNCAAEVRGGVSSMESSSWRSLLVVLLPNPSSDLRQHRGPSGRRITRRPSISPVKVRKLVVSQGLENSSPRHTEFILSRYPILVPSLVVHRAAEEKRL